jgi:hypothetical protein
MCFVNTWNKLHLAVRATASDCQVVQLLRRDVIHVYSRPLAEPFLAERFGTGAAEHNFVSARPGVLGRVLLLFVGGIGFIRCQAGPVMMVAGARSCHSESPRSVVAYAFMIPLRR